MKIKEVCKRTGLTERTVRYYVEEGLIRPETTVRNGREYRDYSERDIEELETIAGLRKLFFTIDEIKDMLEEPERIGEVLAAYKLKLAADAKAKAAIVEALNRIDVAELKDASAVAGKLKPLSDTLPLPQRDIHPNFGRFEPGSKAEREREYEQFVKRQEQRYKRGKIIVISIAAINALSSFLSLFASFNLFNFIVQAVLSICLVAGVSWVRYFFAVGAALSVFFSVVVLVSAFGAGEPLIGWLYVANLVYSGTACYLLFRSEAVSDFLYTQKNG